MVNAEDDQSPVLLDLNTFWEYVIKSRSHVPSFAGSLVGRQVVKTAPWYSVKGYPLSFIFTDPLTDQDISRLNEIAHWMNQNIIIRLYAILDCHGLLNTLFFDDNRRIKQGINKRVDNWEFVEVVRQLRNRFAHGSGKYNSEDTDHKKTLDVMFRLRLVSTWSSDKTEWPLAIDTVIEPIFKGCRQYAIDCMAYKDSLFTCVEQLNKSEE